MKKLLTILLLSFLLFSCKEKCKKTKEQFHTYKEGDIVYLKPDSVRAIIVCINQNRNENYDIDFYLLGRIHREYIDTIYFYNNKKLKQ
jgi:hypothetical protein